jgi:hypothetical protein
MDDMLGMGMSGMTDGLHNVGSMGGMHQPMGGGMPGFGGAMPGFGGNPMGGMNMGGNPMGGFQGMHGGMDMGGFGAGNPDPFNPQNMNPHS